MKQLLLTLIVLYQKGFSPLFPPKCRFYPTCSNYALMVIRSKGLYHGLFYTLKRLLRCHPFSDGGIDYPPCKFSR